MKQKIITILKFFGLYNYYRIPERIVKRFIPKPDGEINDDYLDRLNRIRNSNIPFLVENIGLDGKKVMEIGSGEGCSTIALSEQGASVTGIDIDETFLQAASSHLNKYGLNARLINANAVDIEDLPESESWDIVIFYAALEHMTPAERIRSLKAGYKILKPGGYLCVLGSPNRLWYTDIHTSMMPFYHWLQDDIAIEYSRFSSRKHFSDLSSDALRRETLYRWGIGVSYHEFEIALGSINHLKVVGCMHMFLRKHNLLQKMSYRVSDEYRYKKILARAGPKSLHPGFYESYIDIIIQKQ